LAKYGLSAWANTSWNIFCLIFKNTIPCRFNIRKSIFIKNFD
jgi:hypothetical protein